MTPTTTWRKPRSSLAREVRITCKVIDEKG